MNFKDVKNINIPEGTVIKITDSSNRVIWKKGDVEPDYPDLPTPNGYEIYYTSTDGNIVKLSTLYNGVKPISNTYENGIGRMLFEKELTEIGQEMFDSCYTLQTIILPNSITTIVRWAFYRCVNLINITLPNSVTNIGNAVFNICNSLNQITSLNPIAPTLGENVFFDLPEVGTLYVPEGATGYDVWLENLPEGWSIQYIVPDNPDVPDTPIPNNNEIYYTSTDGNIIELSSDYSGVQPISNTYENGVGKMVFENNLTEIGDYAFHNRHKLTSVKLPNSVKTIDYSAFENCSSLQSIELPSTLTTIDYGAFYKCSSLQSVKLPNSVKTINISAFEDCSSLQSIVIPEGVTSISSYAFSGCSSLQSIELPSTLKTINNYAFRYCSSLQSITCKAMVSPTIQRTTFTSISTNVPTDTPKVLRVPEGATGYDSGDDSGYWKSYVIDKGFTIEYITE